MVFPFTFALSVPGIANPFSSNGAEDAVSSDPPPRPQPNPAAGHTEKIQITRRRPSPAPSTSPSAPISRKRGWEPAFAEPSATATTLASSSGYLDTPAKYRDQLASMTDMQEIEDLTAAAADLPPPPKRRRGLAGSIVSTALSAALIGTAVGLTVYRMWRDRGKESSDQLLAPPPYHEGEWEPSSSASSSERQHKGVYITPPTPRSRKPRVVPSSTRRHVNPRRTHVRTALTPPRTLAPASSSISAFPEPQPEFNFGSEPNDSLEDPDDQMDWIGGKISSLIAEGQKALGREVVVMSEAQEDEVDDGSGNWEDEDDAPRRPSVSRRGSMRGRMSPPSYAASMPSSYQGGSASRSSSRGAGAGLPPSTPSMGSEFGVRDDTSFESPELRASMEAARARYMRNRA
ncbi:hypothetical protein BD626DRAFT_488777 [Schizophyllum amplum]|uniref:Uncharacterized protein n=1 Tax=Schizophyllum amplum TaxID=97359 RepID=A0A550CKX6_9AGAR|nr:hypothetical protein BD626DRAFT_488777 [Auriculariopsis ampla]